MCYDYLCLSLRLPQLSRCGCVSFGYFGCALRLPRDLLGRVGFPFGGHQLPSGSVRHLLDSGHL